MDFNVSKNMEDRNFNWPILFIIALASIVAGIYRDGIAALFPFLQRDFDLTRAQLGLHSTLFFLTSAFVSIFTGRLVDLKESKWSLGFGTMFMGFFLILHSIAPNFIILLVLAAFTGLVMSIITPASNKVIVEWFPRKWRSTSLGILSAAFPVGGMMGAIFLPFLGGLFGWRKTILFPGVLALFYAFFLLHFYQNKGKGKDNLQKNRLNSISFWKSFNQLIKNSDLLSVSIFGIFLGATSGAIAAHFTLFLYLDYGLTESIAGLGFAVVQSGSILGMLVWGLICDRFLGTDKRKTFLYIGFLFTFLSLNLGLFLRTPNPPISTLFILAFLAGFAGRGWLGLYLAAIAETVKEKHIGIAVGFSLLFARSGIMLAPPIFGYIADLRGSYDLSWLLLGLTMFLASVGQYLFYVQYSIKRKRLDEQKSTLDDN